MSERKLRLSYTNPSNKTREYNVIHNSSAVKRRCNDVFVFVANVLNIKKNNNTRVLTSPKNTILS